MKSRPRYVQGGGFLLGRLAPGELFTREDLGPEQNAIRDTVKKFWDSEIAPNIQRILEHEPGLVRSLMKKAAGIGLMGISIPERYGGMELDLISALVVAEETARDGSYMVWEGGHTTIGTLPLVYFGTEQQKLKYLPRLASVDILTAYALTEAHAGSDALAARTRADLADDGRHYVLNGQKMWITNAGEAGLFTVFAKVDGRDFTAFLVERNFEGLRIGAEERKMGLRGSSTTALYLDNVRVPVENVLGEVGRGHIIALNVLNIGRLRMGASASGAAKEVLGLSIRYANQRRAFGSPISEFGAIRQKLAEMAIRTFANESIVWRTAGLIEQHASGVRWDSPDAARRKLAAVYEFAPECSMVKVFGSEMQDYVVDEGVQIHGGYGYHEDYAVERAYRDSRINRIFEGTNEINRLLLARMLLKRALAGTLPLWERVDEILDRPAAGHPDTGLPENDPGRLLASAKRIALVAFGLARKARSRDLPEQQELLMYLADIVIQIYAMESTVVRSEKLGGSFPASDIVRVFAEDSMSRIAGIARNVIGACRTGDESARWAGEVGRLARFAPSDLIGLRQNIARHLIERERYAL